MSKKIVIAFGTSAIFSGLPLSYKTCDQNDMLKNIEKFKSLLEKKINLIEKIEEKYEKEYEEKFEKSKNRQEIIRIGNEKKAKIIKELNTHIDKQTDKQINECYELNECCPLQKTFKFYTDSNKKGICRGLALLWLCQFKDEPKIKGIDFPTAIKDLKDGDLSKVMKAYEPIHHFYDNFNKDLESALDLKNEKIKTSIELSSLKNKLSSLKNKLSSSKNKLSSSKNKLSSSKNKLSSLKNIKLRDILKLKGFLTKNGLYYIRLGPENGAKHALAARVTTDKIAFYDPNAAYVRGSKSKMSLFLIHYFKNLIVMNLYNKLAVNGKIEVLIYRFIETEKNN